MKRSKQVTTTINSMLMLVLTCSMSARAQTDTSNDSSVKKDQSTVTKTSMTGCIMEKDGKYMMTNNEHPDGFQLVSSEDLKPHLGHKVKVTGMMDKMDAISGDALKSDDKTTGGENPSDKPSAGGDNLKHDKLAMMSMKVSSIKMISEQCDMPKSGSKKPAY